MHQTQFYEKIPYRGFSQIWSHLIALNFKGDLSRYRQVSNESVQSFYQREGHSTWYISTDYFLEILRTHLLTKAMYRLA